VGERLVERGGGGGLARDGHAVLDHLLGLPGLVGVVGEAGELDLRVLDEGGEHLPVVVDPGGGGQLLLDGAAGELVPEPDVARVGLQDAAAFRPVQRRGAIAEQPLDQPALGLAGDRGQQLERLLGVVVQLPEPGEHRVTDRRGHLVVRAGQDLGHEERVAAGR
jgi:hypothetical protein